MKIYLAGKITGDIYYKDKFEFYQKKYENKGCTVLNPAKLPEGMTKADYMMMCIAAINISDMVIFMDGWKDSAGAKLEKAYCDYIGKPNFDDDVYIENKPNK